MNPVLLIAFFLIGYLIHLRLCWKFDTDPQKVKTIILFQSLTSILIAYFPNESHPRTNLFLILGWTIVLIDNAHHRIPNFITGYLSLALVLIALVDNRLLDSITGGFEFLLFFGVLAIAAKLKIGIGDVKLAGVIGLMTGVVAFQELISFVLVAAILGLCTLLTGPARMGLKARIPFAAPMISAAILIWPIWPK
jgi:Flp pilus assembly protein protease CpaA